MLKMVFTEGAPKPVGPYSQALTAGGFVWASGQIGIDPASGELVKGDVEAEAEQALRNLSRVLAAAGTGLNRVVKTLLFITDMNDFGRVNSVYARYFQEPFPARSTVQVSALPKGARVEIEAVAVLEQER
jgi:2-iminobutanoate/2-iminopropanoate deaminase